MLDQLAFGLGRAQGSPFHYLGPRRGHRVYDKLIKRPRKHTRPVELDQQPEASLAWWWVTTPAKRRQPDQTPCD